MTQGQVYTIGFTAVGEGTMGSFCGTEADTYPGGSATINGEPANDAEGAFRAVIRSP